LTVVLDSPELKIKQLEIQIQLLQKEEIEIVGMRKELQALRLKIKEVTSQRDEARHNLRKIEEEKEELKDNQIIIKLPRSKIWWPAKACEEYVRLVVDGTGSIINLMDDVSLNKLRAAQQTDQNLLPGQ